MQEIEQEMRAQEEKAMTDQLVVPINAETKENIKQKNKFVEKVLSKFKITNIGDYVGVQKQVFNTLRESGFFW